MSITLLFILIQSISNTVSATAQVPDILLYKGKEVSIFNNPLESYYSEDNRPEFILDQEACLSTACWRGYIGKWEIYDDKLYLIELKSFCYEDDGIKADLSYMFKGKYQSNKVLADWYSGNLIISRGKLLYYDHMGYESVYQKEINIEIKNGVVHKIEKHNNSKTRLKYLESDNLSQIVIENLDPDDLNLIDSELKAYVDINSKEGKVLSAEIVNINYHELSEKILKIIENIDNWDILYRHGKEVKMNWYFPVIINDENKLKYSR